MQKEHLTGLRVLVTRPLHQAQHLIQALRSHGAEPIAFPLLKISPITESDTNYSALKQKILDLDNFQHLIFVSPNAVHNGYDWIDQYWPQLPIGIKWLAIGKQSANALSNYGIDAYHSPLGYDSETLLASPALDNIRGDKVLIMRGEGGREKLAEELRARGAEVSYAELYRREQPTYNDGEVAEALYNNELDAILISSGEGLHNLMSIGKGSQQQFSTDSLLKCHLIVPSERIKHDAESAGFTRITTAAGPDDQSMITTLLQ
ncbi:MULTISPECIES: uroporphyrinogen-III synthase [unclassified Neptuniibacter]|jgi:uroporphyrinogen-III synthase|uniref:uroporphyrinogen-III synthase n=1 Tax=unclassified Neptuniibacter TaxID=2630693 RepID=UPI0026E3246D|nr:MULTISPECIES: uroporphyrinogen-III synthase [unclassified Neptuniibacter]MDO6514909.1 uroporphyrinogen-III synthase [Neptuniibacter sp. 2_MG-2023]MDO6594513.1 uroporphyrinogen-III synthase [Neptuniibacter sp. 1_MG-2023]